MIILKCTGEIRKALRLSDQKLANNAAGDRSLNTWIVHQFPVGRTQFFLFMNELTLLSFVLYKGKKPVTAKTMPGMLMNGFAQLLAMQGVNKTDLQLLLDQFEAGVYAKTDSRSVLGYMNEIIHSYRYLIQLEGGLKSCDLTAVIMRVNYTPQTLLDWRSPWKATASALTTLKQTQKRPRYTVAELLAQSDKLQAPSQEDRDWMSSPVAGKELH
jgi:hypothetical protein